MKRLALALFAVAACGGGGSTNVKPTLQFSERTDAEISRIIAAAGGTDMFGAQAQLDSFSDPSTPDPCPAIAIDGITVTVTGGCTTKDGVKVEGDAVAVNPTSWDGVEFDFQHGTSYDLHRFAVTRETFTTSYDGSVRIEGFQIWDADITSTQLGLTVRSDIHYECSQSSAECELTNSGVELIGVGGALVSGTVTLSGNSGHAEYELRGADRLNVTIDRSCVTWAIDGGAPHKTGACQ